MNCQTVAILTTDKIAEDINKRLDKFPEEKSYIKIKKLRANVNLYYWKYEPFFNCINNRLCLTDLLSNYDNDKEEGYKLLAYGDDDFSEIRTNIVGSEMFEDYCMEYRFNFLDELKRNNHID